MAAPQHPGPHPLYIPSFPHLNPPPCPFLTSTPSAFWLAMLASTRQSAAKVTVHAVSASRLRSGSQKGPVSPAGEQVPQPPSVFFYLFRDLLPFLSSPCQPFHHGSLLCLLTCSDCGGRIKMPLTKLSLCFCSSRRFRAELPVLPPLLPPSHQFGLPPLLPPSHQFRLPPLL
jgi:hypothetical protein